MYKFKKYLILYITFLVLFSLSCIFYYFNILNASLFKVFKFVLMMLLFMVQSNFVYKDSPNKKIIFGVGVDVALILLFLIFSLFSHKFKVKLLFYFLILLCSSVFGIFISHNKRKS